MKVIKEPVPVSWNIQKVCDDINISGEVGCGATLEIEYKDIYTKKYDKGYWSEADQEFVHYKAYSFWFKCPCCGKENSIPDREIPGKIQQLILTMEKESKKLKKKNK